MMPSVLLQPAVLRNLQRQRRGQCLFSPDAEDLEPPSQLFESTLCRKKRQKLPSLRRSKLIYNSKSSSTSGVGFRTSLYLFFP